MKNVLIMILILLTGVYTYTTVQDSADRMLYKSETLYCKGSIRTECHFRFIEPLRDMAQYQDLLMYLNMAAYNTKIVIHLSGPGGRIDILALLVEAITTTRADLEVIVEGNVYSAHAMLAILSPNLTIKGNVLFMFHQSGLTGGISIEEACGRQFFKTTFAFKECVRVRTIHKKTFDDWAFNIVEPYLTEKEKMMFIEGRDVYLTGDEVRELRSNI